MNIKITIQSSVTVATVNGRLDSASSPAAQEQLAALVKPGAKIVIDMHDCDYVSSAGLRTLLWCAKAAAREGAKIVVAGLADSIAEVMDMTGFGGLFPKFDETSAAVKAVGEAG